MQIEGSLAWHLDVTTESSINRLSSMPWAWAVRVRQISFFMLFNTGNFLTIVIAMSITIGIACAMFALEPAIMGSLFLVEVRTSAVSMGYQVAGVFAGGLSPFIATGLYAWSGRQWWPIAAYLSLMGIITYVSAHLAMKATKKMA